MEQILAFVSKNLPLLSGTFCALHRLLKMFFNIVVPDFCTSVILTLRHENIDGRTNIK
jgi:hypothetical protein